MTTKVDQKKVHFPNLITQDFRAYLPNSLWTGDISYIPTKEGWLYLSVILDVFSRTIVGWSMCEYLNS
ncbi:MAG: DDE-type integrase/transposase/recombinase [Silvanigrellaceae bacterium]|nr:DDE-type integrase/transposase/recombinase [Silvanigrellaceae bacterium]